MLEDDGIPAYGEAAEAPPAKPPPVIVQKKPQRYNPSLIAMERYGGYSGTGGDSLFTCSSCRRDLEKGYDSMRKVIWTGQFMAVLSVMFFIAAWAIFIGGIVWSEAYYMEYYCIPMTENTISPPPGQPTGSASVSPSSKPALIDNRTDPKVQLAGYKLPVSEEKHCMPNRPERKHFPMKASHWLPGLIVSTAFLCMCSYSFRKIIPDNIDTPEGVDKEECSLYMACCKSLLMICTVAWAFVGLFISIIYTILMFSFVDLSGESRSHIIVPTVCVLVQCIILGAGLCVGFLAKWLSTIEATRDEEHVM